MDKPTPRKRILVVEDERHISEGIRVNLQLQGYDVKISETGPAGLSDWKHWQPDLVVLDIMLPGIDGITVLKSIRLEDERLPILILSAKGSAEDRVNGLANGVDDYLSKPFNLDEFLLRIDRLLKRDSWLKPEPDSAPVESLDSYSFGSNKIDFKQALAFCKGQPCQTVKEVLNAVSVHIGKGDA